MMNRYEKSLKKNKESAIKRHNSLFKYMFLSADVKSKNDLNRFYQIIRGHFEEHKR